MKWKAFSAEEDNQIRSVYDLLAANLRPGKLGWHASSESFCCDGAPVPAPKVVASACELLYPAQHSYILVKRACFLLAVQMRVQW